MELIISLVIGSCFLLFSALALIKFAVQKWNQYLNKKINDLIDVNKRQNGKHH